MDMHTTTLTSRISLLSAVIAPSRDRDCSHPLSDRTGRPMKAHARTSSRTEGSTKKPWPRQRAAGPVPATRAANALSSTYAHDGKRRRACLRTRERRAGGRDASKHRDEGLVGCDLLGSARVAPNRDLVQHGLKALAEVLIMPHLRATRLGVTNSGAQACEDKKVRITNPGVPSATYLMVIRGAQSLRLSLLARFCEPAQSSRRRCSQSPLNHADAQRFLAPSPKAQSPTTNLALSSTRGTRGTRQADPLDPTALVYAYV